MSSLPTQVNALTSLYEVHRINAPVLSRQQVQSWNKLAGFTSAQTLEQNQNVYLGLFGNDLQNLLSDCAKATQSCNPIDYAANRFDGWAIGAAIYQSRSATFSYAGAQCNVGGVVANPQTYTNVCTAF